MLEPYGFAVSRLKPFFSSLNGGLAEAVERWQIIRRRAVKPMTFNLELSCLSAILDYGVSHGKPMSNPAKETRLQRVLRVEPFIPSREQYLAIVSHIANEPGGLRASRYIRLLATSGMRKDEVKNLKWSDVDLVAGHVVIGRNGTNKNGEARCIPLFDELRSVLTELAAEPH